MRKVLIVGFVFVVVLAAAFALAFRNLDTYLTEHRDEVAAEVATVLGRDVAFDSVAVAWRGGFGVRVEGLRVGDDPAFSQEDFLTADAVDVRVKLWPALFGRVEVGRVILRAPRVFVTQTAAGLSSDSLGAGAPAAGTPDAAAPAPAGAPAALGIALLDMRDGALRFVDRTQKPAVTLEIEQLDVRASELGLTTPVEFEMAAALFAADDQNLTASGTVGPLASETPQLDIELALEPLALDQALRVPFFRALMPEGFAGSGPVLVEADASGTLDELTFAALIDASKAAVRVGDGFDKPAGQRFDVRLEGTRQGERVDLPSLGVRLGDTQVAGSANVVLAEPMRVVFDLGSDAVEPQAFGAGEPGDVLRKLSLKGDVTLPAAGPRGSVALRSPEGRFSGGDYTNLAADVKLRGARTDIESLTAEAFDGSLRGSGHYETRGSASPRFEFTTQLAGMRIESLVAAVADRPAALLNGRLDARVALQGSGSNWEQIQSGLGGDGEFQLADGVLKDFNPAGDTLRALSVIPGIGGGGVARVIAEHPELLDSRDTPLEALAAQFDIRQGVLHVSDLVARTSQYVLSGAGRYTLAGKLDFKTALVFGDVLSRELLGAVPEMRYIRDGSGHVALPVALLGTPPNVKVLPDVTQLANNAAREAIVDAIGEALGGKGAQPAGAPAPTDAGGLLGGILNETLGKKPAPAQPPADAEPPPAPKAEDLGNELLRQGINGLFGGGKGD